jgi:hypothetical protein
VSICVLLVTFMMCDAIYLYLSAEKYLGYIFVYCCDGGSCIQILYKKIYMFTEAILAVLNKPHLFTRASLTIRNSWNPATWHWVGLFATAHYAVVNNSNYGNRCKEDYLRHVLSDG